MQYKDSQLILLTIKIIINYFFVIIISETPVMPAPEVHPSTPAIVPGHQPTGKKNNSMK